MRSCSISSLRHQVDDDEQAVSLEGRHTPGAVGGSGRCWDSSLEIDELTS